MRTSLLFAYYADMSDFDPTDTEANEVREAEKRAEQKAVVDQQVEDLKWLMSDKRGRRFMWNLLAVTGVFANPFTGNSETFFKCGMMSVGQTYLGDINVHCPERYNQMVTEKLNYDRSTAERRRK